MITKSNLVEYRAWINMKARCYNSNVPNYENYGGRGITVCDRWRSNFDNFYTDIGSRPSSRYSLDRIDNDGNYEPSNCRWATDKQQLKNRRSNRRKTHCKNNHKLTLENSEIRYDRSNYEYIACRICRKEYNKKYHEAKTKV